MEKKIEKNLSPPKAPGAPEPKKETKPGPGKTAPAEPKKESQPPKVISEPKPAAGKTEAKKEEEKEVEKEEEEKEEEEKVEAKKEAKNVVKTISSRPKPAEKETTIVGPVPGAGDSDKLTKDGKDEKPEDKEKAREPDKNKKKK